MIFNPRYWKRDLKHIAGELRRCRAKRRWTDASHYALERSMMIGFYAIRRLGEAFQPVELTRSLSLIEFPPTGKKLVSLFWPHLEEHFDLAAGRRVTKNLEFVCNQIIHSHFFRAYFEGGRFAGIFFCSDREKDNRLFQLSLETIIELFEDLGTTSRGRFRLRFAPEKIWDARRIEIG